MIPYWNTNRQLALYKFYDNLCYKLVVAKANGELGFDDFFRFYDYYDLQRYRLGFDALFDSWFNELYARYPNRIVTL